MANVVKTENGKNGKVNFSRVLANYKSVEKNRYSHDFVEYAITSLARTFGCTKQFVISRCLLVGLANDSLYKDRFDEIRRDWVGELDGSENIEDAKKFFKDTLGISLCD